MTQKMLKMKTLPTLLLVIVVFFGFTGVLSAQDEPIVSFSPDSYEELIFDFLLGSGIQAGNAEFQGDSLQIAGFMGGPEALGMASGLVMGTGAVLPSLYSFGSISSSFTNDADLLSVAGSVPALIGQNFNVSNVYDVASLSFHFVPYGDSLSFNFVFGSNEYLTWVNTSFNDVFAFFLAGPGIEGPYSAPANYPDGSINIAVVPGSEPPLPITISSVNDVLNEEYYIHNIPQANGIPVNGYTTSLAAVATGLQVGETYHIRLAIADGSDTALDSFVFLEQGSFSAYASAPEDGFGDFNDDGLLNVADLMVLLENIGCSGSECIGDLNDDGTVDIMDVLIWLALF